MKEARFWFYVPDYPNVQAQLNTYYEMCDVEEHSAEPGRVGGCPDDADVTVNGSKRRLKKFEYILRGSKIKDLMIRGKDV